MLHNRIKNKNTQEEKQTNINRYQDLLSRSAERLKSQKEYGTQ
jgi:hypothetical protein